MPESAITATGPELADGGQLFANLVLFGRLLRTAGLDVPPDQTRLLATALPLLKLGDREQVRDAARAILVHRHEQQPLFDHLFDLFWRHPDGADRVAGDLDLHRHRAADTADWNRLLGIAAAAPGAQPERDLDTPLVQEVPTWSPGELLRHKDFAELTADEEKEVQDWIRNLPLTLPPRRTRRRRSSRRGPFIDIRRTLRASLRFAGEPVDLRRQRRRRKARPLVVLCDISASMEVYTRLLLQFVYAMGQSSTGQAGVIHPRNQLEAFAFGTRLTRITRQLRHRDLERALRETSQQVIDWGGGTRIGESLRTFNYRWARRVLGHHAVVLLISDGWDCGDPALLGREMARLRRSCDRLIWLNPLLGSTDYEPLTRGMQAALPLVSDFLPVHNLDSLQRLGRPPDSRPTDERNRRCVTSCPNSNAGARRAMRWRSPPWSRHGAPRHAPSAPGWRSPRTVASSARSAAAASRERSSKRRGR